LHWIVKNPASDIVKWCRLIKALNERLQKDRKVEPEVPTPPPKRKKEFKGFGKRG
jgi:hypothetical protein